MRFTVFYALVTRKNAVPLHPITAYHECECVVDRTSLFDLGVQVGIEVAKRVDLASFRISTVYCSREPVKYSIYEVQHGKRTKWTGPYDFDQAQALLKELFDSSKERWVATHFYEMSPERTESLPDLQAISRYPAP